MTLRVSVAIPTRNRWDQLERTLLAYAGQSLDPRAFEVLVCDDGSEDETLARLGAFASRVPYRLCCLRQQQRGPAAARNLGAGAARAPVVVFTDDDCVPHERLLEQHLSTTAPGVATIGRIEWHPEVTVTPFMAFLAPGYRFDFGQIADPADAPYRCFYSGNVAVWRADFAAVGGFDEAFRRAFEDIELGYRLHRCGVRLAYNREALVYHRHAVTLEEMLGKQLANGEAAARAIAKHPPLATAAGVPTVRAAGCVARRFYRAALDYALATGLARGMQGRPVGEWPARLEEVLAETPDGGGILERRFHAAEETAWRLEERVAELEAANARLAEANRVLDRALQRATPLKNRLRRLLRRDEGAPVHRRTRRLVP